MKRIMILFFVTLLLVSACDRFDHEVYSDANLEENFLEFNNSLAAASADDLSGVMSWYSESYLNDLETKTDVEHEYSSYFMEYGDSLSLHAEIIEYWKTNRIKYEFWGSYANDILFTSVREDYLIESGEGYIFYGDQISPPELNPDQPVVMVQYFTSTTCGNCPLVASLLEDMYNELGDQLVVLEYIYDEDPAGLFIPEAVYYSAGSQPTSIVQGDYPIIGAGDASLAAYQSRYDQALAEPLNFRFTDLELSVSGNNVTGSVTWEELNEISGENLQLRSVLLEEDPDLYYTSAPSVYFANRVIGGTEADFDNTTGSTAISITCNIPLPENWSMVIWLQDRVSDATADGAHIFNVIKKMGGE